MSPRPPSGTFLCSLDDIPQPGAKGFTFRAGTQLFEMFIVRVGETVAAYENTCPHAKAPLNWNEDIFLTPDKTQILCANHSARFQAKDGICVAGPCIGKALTVVKIHVEAGSVVIGE